MTLEEAIDLFAENNLSLHLSRQESAEWAALARQSAAYPNPFVSVTHEPLYRDGLLSSETYFNLSQPVEWPGLRHARISAVRRLARSAQARFHADSLGLIFEVVKAFVQVTAAEQNYENVLGVTTIFREADRDAEAQYVSGEMSGYHTRRLRVERARYENRLALADLEWRRLRRALEALILPAEVTERLTTTSLRVEPTARVALEEALNSARAGRPEIAAALADVEAAQFMLRQTRKEVVPKPTVTAGFKRQSNGFNGIFLGTAFDVPAFDRKGGSIAARAAQLHQAETRLMMVERNIEQDVRRAYDTYVSLSDRVSHIAGDLLAEAAKLLRAAQVSYAEGEIVLVELLDAADAYFDAQQTTTSLRTDYLIAYYNLQRATGHIITN